MDDELARELRDAGGQRALFVALIAVIESHPNPLRAKHQALAAVESELVPMLNQRDTPQAWLEALQEMQGSLSRHLDTLWPDQ